MRAVARVREQQGIGVYPGRTWRFAGYRDDGVGDGGRDERNDDCGRRGS